MFNALTSKKWVTRKYILAVKGRWEMDSYVQKYCKGNKGTLAKFDVVFWLYTESADDRKPLLVNQFYVKTGILMSRIMFLVKMIGNKLYLLCNCF